jgi:hypothetical protein
MLGRKPVARNHRARVAKRCLAIHCFMVGSNPHLPPLGGPTLDLKFRNWFLGILRLTVLVVLVLLAIAIGLVFWER